MSFFLKTVKTFTFALGTLLPATAFAAPVNAGTTTVIFNTGTLSTLTSAGFSITPISPATLATMPAVAASFPIIGGDTTSVINHSGGLTFTRMGTSADIQNFAINVTNNTLFGQVMTGGTTLNNVALFDISASGGNTNLALSSAFSGAINQVFGVSLPAGTPIGTATVTPVPEPASFAMAGLSLLGGVALWRRTRRAS